MRRAALLALIVVAAWPASSAAAASSAGCAASTFPPDRSPGFADTTWPTEHADGWRTHAVATGLPSDVAKLKLRAATATMPPVPVCGYVGTGRDVYVIGGSPYLLDVFTELIQGAPTKSTPLLTIRSKRYAETVTPYVARIDTKTMKVTQLPLTQGTSANYTGGLLLHSNGFLYAVDRATLYKIDLSTFTVVAAVALPLAPDASGQPNEQTAYNGIQVTGEGDLILKGWASTGGGNLPPGILLRIDPNDLSTKAQLITTDVAAARMALAVVDGAEYLYFPDQKQSVRFLLGTNSFTLDAGFTKTYLTAKGTTEASSDVYMGRGVVFATNTDPTATTPMQVFAQGNGGTPFRATQAFSSNGAGWNFFMVAGDPYQSGIVAVQDQLSGHIAGYQACAGGRSVKKLWENDAIASSAGMAINYKAGQLYADDRRCSSATKCTFYLDVLSLRSGNKLADVKVKGTKPTIGQIFIGPGAVYYTATETHDPHGYVTRVTAR